MKIYSNLKHNLSRLFRSISKFFAGKKEGIIAGGANNDPAGTITYLQIGASSGYALLWLMVVTTPMLIVVTQMAAKIGIILRLGLARVLKDYYGRRIAFSCRPCRPCEHFTISANIAGMADLVTITVNMEAQYVLFVVLVGLFVLLFSCVSAMRTLVSFCLSLRQFLLSILLPPFLLSQIGTVLPLGIVGARMSFELHYWMLVVGAIGTIIAPYIIFWETTAEIEEKKTIKDLKETNSGISWGMTLANIICILIVVLAATVLGGHGGVIENIRQASEVLRPLAGDAAFGLFAIGILASGFVAVPVLISSTAYMVADLLGWRAGLDKKNTKLPLFICLSLFR